MKKYSNARDFFSNFKITRNQLIIGLAVITAVI